MARTKQLLCLDVGAARIGVAMADSSIKIAIPSGFVPVDGTELTAIAEIVFKHDIHTIVIGYPRNQSGDVTNQTTYVEEFAGRLKDIDAEVVYQDESLTSVIAEKRLISRGAAYSKGDIDTEAAVIILQDYLEQHA